jgi:hypothetical protein
MELLNPLVGTRSLERPCGWVQLGNHRGFRHRLRSWLAVTPLHGTTCATRASRHCTRRSIFVPHGPPTRKIPGRGVRWSTAVAQRTTQAI